MAERLHQFLTFLDANRRKYTRDVRMKLAKFASKMSYNDSRLEFETATGVHIPKRTIHCFVQEVAQPILEANKTAEEPRIVVGDSTEVRTLGSREMNNVHVILSDGGQLLHLGVNSNWPIIVRLMSNACRRSVQAKEKTEMLDKLGEIMLKEGIEQGDIFKEDS